MSAGIHTSLNSLNGSLISNISLLLAQDYNIAKNTVFVALFGIDNYLCLHTAQANISFTIIITRKWSE